jgi:hypothetical protein
MRKMTSSGEEHRDSRCLRRGNYFFVSHAATRLNDRSYTAIDQNLQAIGKWKECIASGDAIFGAFTCAIDR